MLRRIAVLALAAAAVTTMLPLSSALFTSRTTTTATVRSSVDWTAPQIQLADPGLYLRGTVRLAATASDTDSTLDNVQFELATTGTGSWQALCTTSLSPFTCDVITTAYPDGRYDLRATAVDLYSNSTSSTVTARWIDNTAPSVVVIEPTSAIRGTATISTSVYDSGSGVASVTLQRAPAGTETWTTICVTSTEPYSCVWNTTSVASDDWDLRAIATDRAGNTRISPTVDVLVDNIAPTVSMTDPGSPLRGTVTLSSVANDTLSGVASVAIQWAPAGSSTWTTACTSVSLSSPYACSWTSTTIPDGTYDFRAVAVDGAGNTTTSGTVKNRVVDNTVSSVSVQDPGAFLSGVVTVTANANSNAGVVSVRIQRAPAGSGSWTDLCTTTTPPYSCTWNTTTVADGLYDLRAILVDGSGKTTTSAIVSARRVDNSPVRGLDVQAVNGGGTAGRLDPNDVITYTYSKQMSLTSIMGGWTGGPQAVVVRLRDGGLVGGANTDDTFDVFTTSTLTTPVRLGSVNLRGDFIKGGKTFLYNATMTQSTTGAGETVVNLTIGTSISGGGLRTLSASTTMIWTPSSSATDLIGQACSTAPVTETGALDRDL